MGGDEQHGAYRKLGAVSRSDAASMILDPDEGLAEMVLGANLVEGVPDPSDTSP